MFLIRKSSHFHYVVPRRSDHSCHLPCAEGRLLFFELEEEEEEAEAFLFFRLRTGFESLCSSSSSSSDSSASHCSGRVEEVIFFSFWAGKNFLACDRSNLKKWLEVHANVSKKNKNTFFFLKKKIC